MSTAHQIPPTEAGLAAHDKTAPADCVHPVCSAVVECDGTTHYAGCACHERGWQNKWECAVEMAAQAEAKLATIEDIAVQLRELLWAEASGMMQGAMVSCPAECIAFAKWWIQKELGRKIDVPDDYPVFKPNVSDQATARK